DLLLEAVIGLVTDRALRPQTLERLALVLDRAQPQLIVRGRLLRMVDILRHRAGRIILLAHRDGCRRRLARQTVERRLHHGEAGRETLFLRGRGRPQGGPPPAATQRPSLPPPAAHPPQKPGEPRRDRGGKPPRPPQPGPPPPPAPPCRTSR